MSNRNPLTTHRTIGTQPTLREQSAELKADIARAGRARRLAQVTGQPEPASLPRESAADRRASVSPPGGPDPHDAGRGHPDDGGRADAARGQEPLQGQDMGRHETFENAAPIAEALLAGTMLGRTPTTILPEPGSSEAWDAYGAACREHTLRTQFANDYPDLSRDSLTWWTQSSLGRALETGDITPVEAARLFPLASERELRMTQVEHELNMGALHALAFADQYPFPADDDEGAEPDPVRPLIEAHVAARAALDVAAKAQDRSAARQRGEDTSDAAMAEADLSWDAANRAEVSAWNAVCTGAPTTLAGVLALTRHLAKWAPENHGMAGAIDLEDAIGSIADGLTAVLAQDPEGADAELIRLGREFDAAAAREGELDAVASAACEEARRRMPERPAALLFREDDRPFLLRRFRPHTLRSGVPPIASEVEPQDVEGLRGRTLTRRTERPVTPEDGLPPDARTVVGSEPWPEAQARADEIVAAWDAWSAERDRVRAECGEAAAEEAVDAASRATRAIVERIAAEPATAAAGFRVKLRAMFQWSEEDDGRDQSTEALMLRSLRRDAEGGEATRLVEAAEAEPQIAEPSDAFVRIAASTREAAADALADARVSPELRTAIAVHRDATLAMLLSPDDSNAASEPLCTAVEASGEALRAVPARSLADVRAKLAFLLPEILPDVNGTTPTAFLENVFDDVERLVGAYDLAGPSSMDADLLAMGGELDAAHARWRAATPGYMAAQAHVGRAVTEAKAQGASIASACEVAWNAPGISAANDMFEDIGSELERIAKAIWRMPARTPLGLAVKARATLVMVFSGGEYERGINLGEDEDLTEQAARALIEACCTLGGVDWTGKPTGSAKVAEPAANPARDLSGLTVPQLARLHETAATLWHGAGMFLNAPFAWDDRRENYGPVGRIIEREVDRLEELASAVAKEARQRTPRGSDERDERFGILVRHRILGGGPLDDRGLIAEIAQVWSR